ncbi:hypothetical protein GCM10011571_02430 [Marinithermofilum abyssi]|uniref:Uncharacterized protein n=1 Tax=Marinithermofilum abyssi TaxID=1571185 RepID=A0A8J2VFY5_9BACL|nr:hypothetical protein [Marinithermofilum abyssi]GGE04911.1 hypothetical protein GCM10011571_02430 [Marinithermofilum abyssi]
MFMMWISPLYQNCFQGGDPGGATLREDQKEKKVRRRSGFPVMIPPPENPQHVGEEGEKGEGAGILCAVRRGPPI